MWLSSDQPLTFITILKLNLIDTDKFLMCLLLDHLWVLFPDVVMVIASEVAVDIVKHAFITKFNDISADVSLFCTFTVYSSGHGAVSVSTYVDSSKDSPPKRALLNLTKIILVSGQFTSFFSTALNNILQS